MTTGSPQSRGCVSGLKSEKGGQKGDCRWSNRPFVRESVLPGKTSPGISAGESGCLSGLLPRDRGHRRGPACGTKLASYREGSDSSPPNFTSSQGGTDEISAFSILGRLYRRFSNLDTGDPGGVFRPGDVGPGQEDDGNDDEVRDPREEP